MAASWLADIFPPASFSLLSVCKAASFALSPIFIYLYNQDDYSMHSEASGSWPLAAVLVFYGEDRVGY